MISWNQAQNILDNEDKAAVFEVAQNAGMAGLGYSYATDSRYLGAASIIVSIGGAGLKRRYTKKHYEG